LPVHLFSDNICGIRFGLKGKHMAARRLLDLLNVNNIQEFSQRLLRGSWLLKCWFAVNLRTEVFQQWCYLKGISVKGLWIWICFLLSVMSLFDKLLDHNSKYVEGKLIKTSSKLSVESIK